LSIINPKGEAFLKSKNEVAKLGSFDDFIRLGEQAIDFKIKNSDAEIHIPSPQF
jgi:hypothetical protein